MQFKNNIKFPQLPPVFNVNLSFFKVWFSPF